MVEQECQPIVDGLSVNSMVIIKDKYEGARCRRDVIDQGREQRFEWRWVGSSQDPQGSFPDVWVHLL